MLPALVQPPLLEENWVKAGFPPYVRTWPAVARTAASAARVLRGDAAVDLARGGVAGVPRPARVGGALPRGVRAGGDGLRLHRGGLPRGRHLARHDAADEVVHRQHVDRRALHVAQRPAVGPVAPSPGAAWWDRRCGRTPRAPVMGTDPGRWTRQAPPAYSSRTLRSPRCAAARRWAAATRPSSGGCTPDRRPDAPAGPTPAPPGASPSVSAVIRTQMLPRTVAALVPG